MSIKAVLMWLVLAGVLGGATLFLLRSGPAGASSPTSAGPLPVGERLFDFVPSSVQSVAVAHPDGSTDIVERRAADFASSIGSDAEWFVRTVRSAAPAAAQPPSWPVASSHMQGLLRTLADVRALALPEKDASLGPTPTAATLTFRDGTRRTVRLADRTLAGMGLVEVTSTAGANPSAPGASGSLAPEKTVRAIVSDDLHRVFTNPGPRAWRERAFFAAIAGDAARVRLENPRQRLALGKTSGQWSLREPVAAPADPAAVQRLLAALGKIAIDDFLDFGAPGASTGLESPSARIELEADRRTVLPTEDVQQRVARLELVIGCASDTTSRRVFAAIEGQNLVLLDARALETISLEAGAYIWPYSTRTPGPDIGMIIVGRGSPATAGQPAASASAGRTVLKRSAARWVKVQPDGLEMMLAEQDLKDADALVSFLCGDDRPASPSAQPAPGRETGSGAAGPKIEVSTPEGFRTLGTVELRTLADAPLDILEAGAARPGTLTLKTGQVYRTWPLNKVPPMLAALVTVAEPTPSPGPEPEPEPEMK